MNTRNQMIRMTVAVAALGVVAGCSPKTTEQEIVFDPFKRYPLGQVNDCSEYGTFDERLNTQNSLSAGFGCAHQSNITAQIADPNDLIRHRPISPSDPIQRERILNAYRQGTSTSGAQEAQGTTQLIQ